MRELSKWKQLFKQRDTANGAVAQRKWDNNGIFFSDNFKSEKGEKCKLKRSKYFIFRYENLRKVSEWNGKMENDCYYSFTRAAAAAATTPLLRADFNQIFVCAIYFSKFNQIYFLVHFPCALLLHCNQTATFYSVQFMQLIRFHIISLEIRSWTNVFIAIIRLTTPKCTPKNHTYFLTISLVDAVFVVNFIENLYRVY